MSGPIAPRAGPRRRRRPAHALAALLAAAAVLATTAAAQEALVSRSRVEAAFVRNFARYVTWPAAVFADDRAPWRVCVFDGDSIDETLENTLTGRHEQGRGFEVVRSPGPDRLSDCQIAYIGTRSAGKRHGALARLRSLPVLTVGTAPEFLAEGGMIRLLAGEHVEMSINLDQARAVSLSIPAKMLEVAREVVENGQTRVRR